MLESTPNARMSCRVTEDGTLEVGLSGAYTMTSDRLPRCPHAEEGPWTRIVFRDEGLADWDTALLVLIRRAERAAEGADLDFSGLPEGVRKLIDLMHSRGGAVSAPPAGRPLSWLGRLGIWGLNLGEEIRAFLDLIGRLLPGLGRGLLGRARTCPGAFSEHLWSSGPGALGIVSVISLLVGAILAFVGAVQLGMFGAELFVADLVGLGMVMEMGALMTGVILAGRTGAAFAAELATMRVNEEVDALQTMGLRPAEYLILPRVAAISLMIPLLVLYANVLGILGGALAGVAVMDIPFRTFFDQALGMMTSWHVGQGLIKGASYGVWIGLAGCHRGMRSGRNASSVGRAATSAVVTGIVGIVVIDAAWTFLFMWMEP